MTANLTAVSLFAGVGGIDLALERAGVHVTAAVEINAAARGVIAEQRPDIALFDDVTKVTPDELRATGFVPERGILAGGFPCQDLSVAGRRAGLGGARSGLFWHIMRLADALRPRWLLLENVPGLLSSNDGADMGTVVTALGDGGYGFAYRVLDAQFFGVPQQRRRVFFVGHLGDGARPVQVLLEPEGSNRDLAARGTAGADIAATLTSGTSGPGISAPGRRQEDDINLVVANCLTAREGKGPDSDATTTLIVSALAANGVGTCGADDNQAQAGHLIISPTLTASMGSNVGHPGDAGKDEIVLKVAEALSVTGHRTHALTSEGHDASEDGTGRGTPIIAFSHTAGIDQQPSETVTPTMKAGHDTMPSVAYALGSHAGSNGEATNEAHAAGGPVGMGVSEERAYALRAGRQQSVATETVVRRLTPLECERLQGFPDDWTTVSNGKRQADSPRYQQMGNAVAVPVVEWIAKRIVEASE